MSPHPHHIRTPPTHSQPVVRDPRQPARRTAARTYCAAVVRELPPRRDYRAGLGTW